MQKGITDGINILHREMFLVRILNERGVKIHDMCTKEDGVRQTDKDWKRTKQKKISGSLPFHLSLTLSNLPLQLKLNRLGLVGEGRERKTK